MKCPQCKSCTKVIIHNGTRYYFCPLCTHLYQLERGFSLRLLYTTVEEIKEFLQQDITKLLKLD